MSANEPKHSYRLPPCPSYDVEGMEQWLSDMANEGLFLAKDGFFLGVATFERGKPKKAKYRLEAAVYKKRVSLSVESDNGPSEEQLELNEKYSWEYVAKRGDFFIYRSFDKDARELNTDAEVQAMALNAVKKRMYWNIFDVLLVLVYWCAIFPMLASYRGIFLSPFLTMIELGTPLVLLGLIWAAWSLVDAVRAAKYMRRLQRRLREEGTIATGRDWRKDVPLYHLKRFGKAAVIIVFVIGIVVGWWKDLMGENRVMISDYEGTVPFATLRDFVGEDDYTYRETMTGLSYSFNTVRESSDWLAPKSIEWAEYAELTLADGRKLEGDLNIEYHETVSSFVAQRVAAEYYSRDKLSKRFEPLEPLGIDADYAVAYKDDYFKTAVVIQKGNIVIQAKFHSHQSSSYEISLNEWAGILAESIPAR